MFKVFIAGESGPMVCVAKTEKLEDSVQFALNLHRSSNCSHTVSVFDDKAAEVLSLKLL